jgi:hypothetical protein
VTAMRRVLLPLALAALVSCATTPDGKTRLLRAGELLYVGKKSVTPTSSQSPDVPPPAQQATPSSESPAAQ